MQNSGNNIFELPQDRLMNEQEVKFALQWFRDRMFSKLKKHIGSKCFAKSHLPTSPDRYFLNGLWYELQELIKEMPDSWNIASIANMERIINECADVANFAMMLAFNAGEFIYTKRKENNKLPCEKYEMEVPTAEICGNVCPNWLTSDCKLK